MPVAIPFDKLNGLDPELVEESKGRGAGCEGRGDIGVRFDRLNELEDRLIPEPVERSKGAATVSKSSAWNSLNETTIPLLTMEAFGER